VGVDLSNDGALQPVAGALNMWFLGFNVAGASTTVLGAAGDDTLDGGAGGDALDGGAGNDTRVNAGAGCTGDTLTSIENDLCPAAPAPAAPVSVPVLSPAVLALLALGIAALGAFGSRRKG
jgi:Ca2+-binding RTX toxin-like protein